MTIAVFSVGAWFGYDFWFNNEGPTGIEQLVAPPLTSDRPENGPLDGGPFRDVPERAADPFVNASATPESQHIDSNQAAALLSSARQDLSGGDLALARAHFSEALNAGLTPQDTLLARTELRKLGRDTIFSGKAIDGDPLAFYYTIRPGDSLQKIAKAHSVTADLLARVNGIANMNLIQAGRRIKVLNGPFHVRVSKSTHTIDIFLGNTFVDHYKVGLGEDDSTPTGLWRVKNKLKNPTYYPPRGGQIVSSDDPENPLGERWIGLEGVEGDAVGQLRYGIHGTNEPNSIGQNASMGCIRLHNEDVESLFELLIVGKSRVEVVN